MRNKLTTIICLALAAAFLPAGMSAGDGIAVPEDAVVINSRDTAAVLNRNVWEQLYSPSDWHYEVRQAPKFMLVGANGNLAFGIGMLLKGTLEYNFDGVVSTDGYLMSVDVPVPRTPQNKSKLGGDATGSKIYARLVGNSPLGGYGAYIETDFTEGLYLRQAWVNLGYLRMGKATSIFNDHDATPNTINEQGPCGATCSENFGLQWTPRFGRNREWTAGIGIEVPQPTFFTEEAEAAQRIPDIPAYIQYSFDDRESRVRLSGIYRRLTYDDTDIEMLRYATGWGVQLSGVIASLPNTTFFVEATYGKGIGSYIYDLCGYGYDLIPTGNNGKMSAPASLSGFAGVQYDVTDRLAVSAFYSQARLYKSRQASADAFRLGQTASANVIYEIIDGLEVGLEYEWARRTNADLASNHANRLSMMCSYTF